MRKLRVQNPLAPWLQTEPTGGELLERLCASAASTTRALGGLAIFPDARGLLAHELLAMLASRRGLSVGELGTLIPDAGEAAVRIIDDLLSLEGGRGIRPLAPGDSRRHDQGRHAGAGWARKAKRRRWHDW